MTFQPHDGLSAAEKMGLDSEVRELKFGDSFSNNNNNKGNSFHTIRYDFKPASVDTSKMATVDVQSGQVTISMPNSDGNGVSVFAGPRKQYAKECVLIIDPETGECVLEKLCHSINLKKTRQEGTSRMTKYAKEILPKDGPPVPEVMKKHPPPGRMETKPSGSSGSSAFETKHSKSKPPTTSKKTLPHDSPITQFNHRTSPPNHSPERLSPAGSNAFDTLLSNHSKQQQQMSSLASTMPSLTNFDDLLMAGPSPTSYPPPPAPAPIIPPVRSKPIHQPPPPAPTPAPAPPPPIIPPVIPPVLPPVLAPSAPKKPLTTALSESSSSSSSSISSSDDDSSEDDSSDDDMEVVVEREPIPAMPSLPSLPTISSFTSSALPHKPNPGANRSMPYSLSDDLQLSESGSDSD